MGYSRKKPNIRRGWKGGSCWGHTISGCIEERACGNSRGSTKKEVEFPGVMKKIMWNFHGSWFSILEFPRDVIQVAEKYILTHPDLTLLFYLCLFCALVDLFHLLSVNKSLGYSSLYILWMMNVMRMWEGSLFKIHNEKLETLESFRAKMVHFLRNFPTHYHWPKFFLENKTERVYYCISNCRLNIQAKCKVKFIKIHLVLWFVHTNILYIPLVHQFCLTSASSHL